MDFANEILKRCAFPRQLPRGGKYYYDLNSESCLPNMCMAANCSERNN